jgi:hypothetical protein
MTMSQSKTVHRENMIVLAVVQALCGSVSSNVKAVTVEFPGDSVLVHFLLRQDAVDDREEIMDDFPVEVVALTLGVPEVGDVFVQTSVQVMGDQRPLPAGRLVLSIRD